MILMATCRASRRQLYIKTSASFYRSALRQIFVGVHHFLEDRWTSLQRCSSGSRAASGESLAKKCCILNQRYLVPFFYIVYYVGALLPMEYWLTNVEVWGAWNVNGCAYHNFFSDTERAQLEPSPRLITVTLLLLCITEQSVQSPTVLLTTKLIL